MGNPTGITQETAQVQLSDAMRLFVGRGRRFSCAAVAAATGIPQRTVESYVHGEATPSLANLLRLVAVLPCEFTNMLLAPAGKGHVAEVDAGDDGLLDIHRQASAVNAMIAGFLSDDGRIDHREEAQSLPSLRELHGSLGTLLAAKDGAK